MSKQIWKTIIFLLSFVVLTLRSFISIPCIALIFFLFFSSFAWSCLIVFKPFPFRNKRGERERKRPKQILLLLLWFIFLSFTIAKLCKTHRYNIRWTDQPRIIAGDENHECNKRNTEKIKKKGTQNT